MRLSKKQELDICYHCLQPKVLHKQLVTGNDKPLKGYGSMICPIGYGRFTKFPRKLTKHQTVTVNGKRFYV